MRGRVCRIFFTVAALLAGNAVCVEAQSNYSNKSDLKIIPSNPDGYLGETTTVQVTSGGVGVDWTKFEVTATTEVSSAGTVTVTTAENGQLILKAPASLPDNLASVLYAITVTGKDSLSNLKTTTTFLVGMRSNLEWESRAIIGWHQAGASSADSKQNLFFDFFVARPFGGGAVYDSWFGLWGQVRVASAPQQKTIPLSEFAAGFVAQLGMVPVNELAQSAEFLTGTEIRLHAWRGVNRIRTIGIVNFFGANGAFSDPTTNAQVFRVPPVNSPQWANFLTHFPAFNSPDFQSKAGFIALVPPDRERFYREYGGGVRYMSYIRDQKWASPSMFTATIGQDQSITGGRYHGPALKFDAFYPLPLSFHKDEARFVYLFGTANLAVAKPTNGTPLALQLVSTDCAAMAPAADIGTKCGVKPYQDNVAVFTIASSRDTYRVGVGVDFIALLKALHAF